MANKMSLEIENDIEKENIGKYKLVFIGEDRWNHEKEKYITNLKNKKVYKYIEEKVLESKTEINDVFDKDKVEII